MNHSDEMQLIGARERLQLGIARVAATRTAVILAQQQIEASRQTLAKAEMLLRDTTVETPSSTVPPS